MFQQFTEVRFNCSCCVWLMIPAIRRLSLSISPTAPCSLAKSAINSGRFATLGREDDPSNGSPRQSARAKKRLEVASIETNFDKSRYRQIVTSLFVGAMNTAWSFVGI